MSLATHHAIEAPGGQYYAGLTESSSHTAQLFYNSHRDYGRI